MKDNSYKRHIAKTLTWRIVGTIDTIILSWVLTGNAALGLQIGAAEFFSKMALYYAHERMWFRINLTKHGKILESKKRHLAKTISWRIIGSISTMLLAWFISGNPFAGIKIGSAEVVTKMLLYYFHERAWYKVSFGIDKRQSENGNEEERITANKQIAADLL